MFRVTIWKMAVRMVAATVAVFMLAVGAVYAGNFVYDKQQDQEEWADNIRSENAVAMTNPLDNKLYFDLIREPIDSFKDISVPVLATELSDFSPGLANMILEISHLDGVTIISTDPPAGLYVTHEDGIDRQKLNEQIEEILDDQYL